MIELTTMTVRLIDSKPDGIRICHVEGESLTTVVVPRELLSEAKRLPDIPKRGIYYLLDEDHGVIGRVYAGQTTQGLARLDAHKSRKEFWNKAIMFLDDESNMDRDVLDALEADAIGYVRTHGSYETDNLETPQPYVNPYKEQTVKRLHKSILFRMAVLGYGLDRTDAAVPSGRALFHTRRKGIVANGRYDERTGRFTVLAGS
ncbi:GIY-YIG nuclease family protein [Parafannyhessea umbonata]|uniref:GIY-YIG nuclease family protein n=1 Tax=Parafannyhessea umbonata TaxID=604330 RepID=UPI001F2A04D9|nr:GIY-YIG nuclease family protein [Parafannyhessea umbonata]